MKQVGNSRKPPLPKPTKKPEMFIACQQMKLLDIVRQTSIGRMDSRIMQQPGGGDAFDEADQLFIKRKTIGNRLSTARTNINEILGKSAYMGLLNDERIQVRLQKIYGISKSNKQNGQTVERSIETIERVMSSHSQKIIKDKLPPTNIGLLKSQASLKSQLTSKSWIVYDRITGQTIMERASSYKREMASLTKIMTCLLTLEIMKQLDFDPKTFNVIITQKASLMTGTSAELAEGCHLTIWDLLHGLMLPSGNDAAYSLAEYMGCLLSIYEQLSQNAMDASDLLQYRQNNKKAVNYFIGEMNKRAYGLGMARTHYSNPHGLSDKNNYSTCLDIARLCDEALNNKEFSQIVTTKQYSCKCLKTGKEFSWKNTHKLLDEGWHGIKTGVTPNAGPCLSSFYRQGKDAGVIIILLACQTMELRYDETKTLLEQSKYKK